jgi:tripartite ATP-independent transporter DctP family solute receptor
VTASNVAANIVPELGLLDAPFLFRDAPHARAVLDGPIGTEYAGLMRPKGMIVLAWAENGLRHVTANRPIRKPDDLRGLRIRVPQSEVMVQAFKALGASPEALPFPELYEALRTGRFEAEENPVPTIVAAKFAEVQKCLSLTGHVYSAAFFIASPDLLDDLKDDQRAALTNCAKAGAAASRETGSKGERDGIDALKAEGMTIVADVDRASLAAAAKPALDAAAKQLGADRATRIQAAGA